MAMTSDSSGVYRFDPDLYTQTLGYDANGNLTSLTITIDNNTFKQTLGYTGSNMTSVSPWVKQ